MSTTVTMAGDPSEAPGVLLKRALDAAAVWHADQFRKYPGARVPYTSHVAGVLAILARHGLPGSY